VSLHTRFAAVTHRAVREFAHVIIIIIIIIIAVITIIDVTMAAGSTWSQMLGCYCLHPHAVPRRGRDARPMCHVTVTSCGIGAVAGSVRAVSMTGSLPLAAVVMERGGPFKAET
jgi:hypothetical protein